MAEPIDYLKTYLNMNPEDYSRMQAQIGGETLPDREIFTMPARAMPMPATRQAMEPMPMPAPQNTEVQSLMDEIASLKAQIEGTQEPADAPVLPSLPEGVDAGGRYYTGPNGENMYQPPMPKIAPGQFQAQVMPTPINLDTGMKLDTSLPILKAPLELTNRMVGEPQKLPQEPQPIPQRSPVPSVSAEQIQKSLDMLAKLPKTNIPIIPDMEEIRQKMADANIPFSTPISFEEQLQTIRDLPPMPPVTQMPQPIKQPRRSGIFGNLLDRVQKQIKVPTPPSMPVSPMLQTKPAYMPTRATNMLDTQQKFAPMRFAGGGLSKALSDLKTRIS
jgi:hypothetical protein